MRTSQYKSLEAHISFWGAFVASICIKSEWGSAAFFVIAVLQMVRQLYWYSKMVAEAK